MDFSFGIHDRQGLCRICEVISLAQSRKPAWTVHRLETNVSARDVTVACERGATIRDDKISNRGIGMLVFLHRDVSPSYAEELACRNQQLS